LIHELEVVELVPTNLVEKGDNGDGGSDLGQIGVNILGLCKSSKKVPDLKTYFVFSLLIWLLFRFFRLKMDCIQAFKSG